MFAGWTVMTSDRPPCHRQPAPPRPGPARRRRRQHGGRVTAWAGL